MKLKFMERYKSSKTIQIISLWYFTIILALLIIGITAIPSILRLEKIAKDIYRHPFSVTNAAIELQYNIVQIRNQILKVLLSSNEEEMSLLVEEINSLDMIVNKNLTILKTDFLGDKQKIIEIEKLLIEWKAIQKSEIESIQNGKILIARKISKDTGSKTFIQLNDLISYVINFAENKAQSFISESENSMRTAIFALGLLIIFILISGFFVLSKVILIKKESERHENKIKEQYLVEAKIQAEKELAKNKNQLTIIADNVSANIFLVDIDFRIKFSNKPFSELFNICIRGLEISSLQNSGSPDFDQEISNIVFQSPKILLVEDVESNRKVVTGFLEKYNIILAEAHNGKKALEIIENNKFDLILMDLQMPEMDGREASLILKKEERFKNIPIIILTASAMKENVKDILNFADGYLCKPISRYELINELTKFLPHEQKEFNDRKFEINNENFLLQIEELIESDTVSKEFKVELNQWFIESERARKSLNTNKLIYFLAELESISRKSNIEPLVKFCRNLSQLITTFSIAKIVDELNNLEVIHSEIISNLSGKKNE